MALRSALFGVGLCAGVLLIGFALSPVHQSTNVLLCSDGRCGQSSKLSREGAERDLDLWSDKEELKNKLDELQTVMDRGMTHKAASQQLNQYFNQLDHEANNQERAALQQAREDSLADAADHSSPSPNTQKNHILTRKTIREGLAASNDMRQKTAAAAAVGVTSRAVEASAQLTRVISTQG